MNRTVDRPEPRTEDLERYFPRSTQALQATIDVLGEFQDLDQLVPRVLEIAARTFAATSCALYENEPSGRIRLRYWYLDGRTLTPTELAELDPGKFGLVRRLAEGFEVPDSYLGKPAAQAIGPVVLDHVLGTSVPEFDEFAVGAGWDFELNIGVGAGGVRASTFDVCRSRDNPFTQHEIALAESLATQLGVALQFARLAEEAREAAVAKERAVAAEQRATELGRADALLRAVVDASRCLVENPDFEGALSAAATTLGVQTGVDRVYVFQRLESASGWALTSRWQLPELEPYAEIGEVLRDRDFPEMVGKLQAGQAYYPVAEKRTKGGTGLRSDLIVPVLVQGRVWGCVGFGDHKASRDWSCSEIRVLEGAAAAISAAVSRHDSEAGLREAMAQEREAAARKKADLVTQVNRAAQESVDRLNAAQAPSVAITESLRSIWQVLSPLGVIGAGFVSLDADGRRLRMNVFVRYGQEVDLSGTSLDKDWAVDEPPMNMPWSRIQQGQFLWGLTSDPTVLVPEARPFHEEDGARAVAYNPLSRGGITFGFVGISLASTEPPSEEQVQLISTLASHLSLAVEMDRLATRSTEAVVIREREAAAERRAEDLAGVNSVLTSSLAHLSGASDMREFLGHVFAEIIGVTGATNAAATLYDQESNRLQLEIFHDGSQPRWGMSGAELAIWAAPYDPDITPAFGIGLLHRHVFVASMMRDQSEIPIENFALPGGLQWLSAIGASDAAVSILFAGGQPVGTFHLHFTNGRTLRPEDLPLLESLSQQAAMALRLVTLSNEAQQAALAREREKDAEVRAAEAHRISDFLSATLGTLAEGADIQQTVGSIVAGLAREIGAAHVFLFRHDPVASSICLSLSYVEGRIRRGASGEEMPLWSASFPDSITPAWQIMTEMRGLFTPEMSPISAEAFGWPGFREYVDRFELSDVGHIVLFAGEKPVGSIGFGLRGGRKLAPSDEPFIEGVAKQAALAIRMADLAEEAQMVAIAREQENAALDRAAELARANQALQASLGTLASGTSGQALLAGILSTVREIMGATSVALRIRDAKVLAAIQDDRYATDACAAYPGFVDYMSAKKPAFIPLLSDEATPIDAKKALVNEGARSQLAVPLLLGDQLIGCLVIRLSSEQAPANEQIELALSLSHQATLAIWLTQLASEAKDEARAKAISDERAALARELHDTLLQSFTGVTLQLRGLGMRAAMDESSRALLAAIEVQATEAVQEARVAVGNLRNLSTVDLSSEILRIIKAEQKESERGSGGPAYEFSEGGQRWDLPSIAGKDMIRIIQESLRNAARHSRGTKVRLELRYEAGIVRIQVKDNGAGFDLEHALCKPGHYGIKGMQERARQIGASLEIRSEAGDGTLVSVRYPAPAEGGRPLPSAVIQ